MSLILSKKIYDYKSLPEQIGIYYFIDNKNIPIYIGKSLNIKKRIQQHLNSKSSKSDKIKNRYSYIRYLETNSELLALIIESQEIKKNKPVLNKKLRKKKRNIFISKYQNENGYYGLKISKEKKGSVTSFRSINSARSFINYISKKYELCEKINTTFSSSHCCFSISLSSKSQKCFCDDNKESYNNKFFDMLNSLELPKKKFLIYTKNSNKPYPFISVSNGVLEGYGYSNTKSKNYKNHLKKLDYFTKDEMIIVNNYYNKNIKKLELISL